MFTFQLQQIMSCVALRLELNKCVGVRIESMFHLWGIWVSDADDGKFQPASPSNPLCTLKLLPFIHICCYFLLLLLHHQNFTMFTHSKFLTHRSLVISSRVWCGFTFICFKSRWILKFVDIEKMMRHPCRKRKIRRGWNSNTKKGVKN